MSLFETPTEATEPENSSELNGSVPAFPRIAFGSDGCVNEVAHGLSKREHFALHLSAAYASADYVGNSGCPHEMIAEWGVRMADALLVELSKPKS